MDLAPDFDEFIGSLTAHGVEFVVVGAYALAFHGAPRFTGDLDILVRPTVDNGARLIAALEAFGFPIPNLAPETIIDRRRMLQMGVPPVQIHVMSTISGVEWDEAWADLCWLARPVATSFRNTWSITSSDASLREAARRAGKRAHGTSDRMDAQGRALAGAPASRIPPAASRFHDFDVGTARRLRCARRPTT
jgi:hypothetical protein